MKNRKKRNPLALVMLLLGTAAMMLRRQLYLTAVDAKGLLLRGSPLELTLLALTAVVFFIPVAALRKDRGSDCYEDNYRASVPSALGHVAAATGIFTLVWGTVPTAVSYLALLWKILGLAAPVCLVLAGFSRLLGKKPFFLLHVIPCLFLLVYVVGCYQTWSSNPQLQDYLFALLAALALILFAYYTAAFEAGLENRKMVMGTGLLAVYLCLAELGWSDCPGLYFGGMLWALTSMCNATAARPEEKD